MKTAGEPAEIRTCCYQAQLKADGREAGQIEVSVWDGKGNFCYQADTEIIVSVEGSGTLIGVDNGNPGCIESMKGNTIHVFHGWAFIVVRSNGQPGKCRVRVTAKELPESIAEIQFEK